MKRNEKGQFVSKGIEKKVSLPGTGLNAVIRITRISQAPPAVSDDMQVKVELALPTNDGSRYLHDSLRFTTRIKRILGESLTGMWGTDIKGTYRTRVDESSAPTWAEAEAKALKYARSEIKPLVEALAARKAALEMA
jgi:hypothetical protein